MLNSFCKGPSRLPVKLLNFCLLGGHLGGRCRGIHSVDVLVTSQLKAMVPPSST